MNWDRGDRVSRLGISSIVDSKVSVESLLKEIVIAQRTLVH